MTVEAALLVGHLLGDFIAQTDRQARAKVMPGMFGWAHMAGHMVTYHATLLAVLIVAGHTTTWAWAATLAISLVSHAFIDRRWPVQRLMRATGSSLFADTEWGPIVVDQVLHVSVLLACAALW